VVTSSETDALCGSWNYKFTYADDSPLDTNAFQQDFGTDPKRFTIYSTDDSLVNTYTIKFTAWQGTFVSNFDVQTFTVVITDDCLSMVLSPSSLPDQTYLLSKDAKSVTYADFSRVPAYCPLTYSLSSVPPGDGLITMVDRTITFFNDDPALLEDQYSVTVTGTYKTVEKSFTFTLDAKHPCRPAVKTIKLPWTDFNYNVFDTAIQNTWTTTDVSSEESSALCGDWNFRITMGDDAALLEPFTAVVDSAPYSLTTETQLTAVAGP